MSDYIDDKEIDDIEHLLNLVNADELPNSPVETIWRRVGIDIDDKGIATAITEKCYNIDIDPDIIIRQAKLIRRLKEALERVLQDKLGMDIHSYYFLRQRCEDAEEKLHEVREIVG